jgi:hypothetical protein
VSKGVRSRDDARIVGPGYYVDSCEQRELASGGALINFV